MQFLPDRIRTDPDSWFLAICGDDPLKGCDWNAIQNFKQLLNSSGYSEADLQQRRFYLLHDLGQLHRQLDQVETEKWEIHARQKTDRSIEAKRQQAMMLKTLGSRRKKIMQGYEYVTSMLCMIIHHLHAVHAGAANPIKDEMSEIL